MFKKLFILIIIVIVSLWTFEKVLDFGLKNNNNIKVSYGTFPNLPHDILIHGPCEPLFSIDPAIINASTNKNAFNSAVSHTDFADNFLQLYLYLKSNPNLKMVLLYVTPESFDLRFNTFHSYRYAPYLSDSVVNKTVSEVDPHYYKWTFIPMMKYAYYNHFKNWEAIQGWKHWLTKDNIPYHKKGYRPFLRNYLANEELGYIEPKEFVFDNFVNTTELENQNTYYELYQDSEKFNWSKEREKYLIKIIELCRMNQVEIILFESPTYQESIKKLPNRNEFLKKIRKISKEINVPFWEFNNIDFNSQQTNFVCPLILSEKGTENFMPSFIDSLKIKIKNSH